MQQKSFSAIVCWCDRRLSHWICATRNLSHQEWVALKLSLGATGACHKNLVRRPPVALRDSFGATDACRTKRQFRCDRLHVKKKKLTWCDRLPVALSMCDRLPVAWIMTFNFCSHPSLSPSHFIQRKKKVKVVTVVMHPHFNDCE